MWSCQNWCYSLQSRDIYMFGGFLSRVAAFNGLFSFHISKQNHSCAHQDVFAVPHLHHASFMHLVGNRASSWFTKPSPALKYHNAIKNHIYLWNILGNLIFWHPCSKFIWNMLHQEENKHLQKLKKEKKVMRWSIKHIAHITLTLWWMW